jgi:hypothetical protein
MYKASINAGLIFIKSQRPYRYTFQTVIAYIVLIHISIEK